MVRVNQYDYLKFQDKDFIYRGLEFEKLPSFTQRLQDEFSHAKVLPHSERLKPGSAEEDKDENREEARIYVCCVQAREGRGETDQGCDPGGEGTGADKGEDLGFMVPDRVRQSRARINVRTFRLDRPVHRGKKDRNNEFKTLWIERTHLVTGEGFPSLLRWQEVDESSRRTEMVPPVTHACESVESKTKELRRMTDELTEQQVQRLSLSLQGVIDAAVNGGVARYREAFLQGEGDAADGALTGEAARLRRLMEEQVDVLEAALAQHGKLVSTDMRPLHEHLCTRWRQLKEETQRMRRQPSPPVRTLSRKVSGNRRGPLPDPPQQSHNSSSGLSGLIYESPEREEGLYSLPASIATPVVGTAAHEGTDCSRQRSSESGPMTTTKTAPLSASSIPSLIDGNDSEAPPLPPRGSLGHLRV